MSTFTLKGQWGNRDVEITWTNGKLTGDPDAVQYVEAMAASYEGMTISSPTDITSHGHLSNPGSAASLMRMIFSGRPECINCDLEPIPEPPEGAIM